MKKPTKQASIRTKRKNQNSRMRAKKANKQKAQSFQQKVFKGTAQCKDVVQPYTKTLHPNQAIHRVM
jgi:hypothetical protein